MAKVGLVFGGRSVEHRVSVSSARTVAAALRAAGHEVIPLGVAMDGCWVPPLVAAPALAGEIDDLVPLGQPILSTLEVLIHSGAEVLFPIIHGTWGEDGSLQGLAEMLDLPYVGTGVTSSAVAMDKLLCKQVLAAAGLPVVDYEIVDRGAFQAAPQDVVRRLERLTLPLFVKPSVGGSSVGVTKVADRHGICEAVAHGLRFDDRLVVERGIVGRELECAVLGHRQLEASAIGEIVPGRDFYDYADKYLEDGAQLIAPAELPAAVEARIGELAVEAFAAIGGWGIARVDFLLEGADTLYINEINTLPGFTAISMYPRLWELRGVPRPDLVDRLVQIAFDRHRDRKRLDEGIKAWIATLAADDGES